MFFALLVRVRVRSDRPRLRVLHGVLLLQQHRTRGRGQRRDARCCVDLGVARERGQHRAPPGDAHHASAARASLSAARAHRSVLRLGQLRSGLQQPVRKNIPAAPAPALTAAATADVAAVAGGGSPARKQRLLLRVKEAQEFKGGGGRRGHSRRRSGRGGRGGGGVSARRLRSCRRRRKPVVAAAAAAAANAATAAA